jgi:hypothetical protein
MRHEAMLGIAMFAVSVVAWPLSVPAADTAADKAESKTERAIEKTK